MRTYGQYCPVAKAAEVLGDRWTLLVVRDLVEGAHRFGELASGLPTMSRTLLSQRLRLLEREGLVERRRAAGGHSEYWLTDIGLDLRPALLSLGAWAARNYSRDPVRRELDPRVLLTWIVRGLRRDALPRAASWCGSISAARGHRRSGFFLRSASPASVPPNPGSTPTSS
jgi:DNA-binding HxlR family transcriptional regulator